MPRPSNPELPLLDAQVAGGAAAADGSVDVPFELTGTNHPSQVKAAPKRSRGPLLGALAVLVALVAGGAAWWGPREPAPPPVLPVAAPETVSPLLDEAMKAQGEGKLSLARQLLATARTRGRVSATEEVRLVQLEAQLQHAERVAEARRAFDEGKPAEARALLEQVLQEEPEHAAALALRSKWDLATPAVVVDAGALEPATPGKSGATLAVTSEPAGASVTVDERAVGTTPLKGLKLAPGPHQVVVARAGFALAHEKVVAAGKPVSVRVRLVAEVAAPVGKGSLRVVTFEEGESTWATVKVDGKRLDKVTPVVLELAAGPHQVQVERAGFQPVDRSVEIQAGKTETVRIELKP